MAGKDTPLQFRLTNTLPLNTVLPFRISNVILLILLGLTGVGFWFIQPIIPLFYSFTDPQQQLVSKWWLAAFPILSATFTTLHFYAVTKLRDWTEIILKLLAWSCVGLQVGLLAICIRLLLLVW